MWFWLKAVLRRLEAPETLKRGSSSRTVRIVPVTLCEGDLGSGAASLLLYFSLGLSHLCEIFLGL